MSGSDAFENSEIYGTYMHFDEISCTAKLYVDFQLDEKLQISSGNLL
jgi:hypothetical protein